MLAHQDRGMRVVKDISRKVRHLRNNRLSNVDVSLRGNQNTETRRCKKCSDEPPGHRRSPGLSHDSRVSSDSEKFIKYRPRGVPSIGLRALALEPTAAWGMELRIHIGRVDQYVGVDSNHYRPSMAW
jgi:hypothetical protein